jgi:hypothetical protein
VERGASTDEYPDADEHKGSVRARTIDIGHPNVLGVALSDRVDRVLRFHQSTAVAPQALYLGSRGAALPFTLILTAGGLSVGGDIDLNGNDIKSSVGDIQLNGDTEVTGGLHATSALSCDGSVLSDLSVIADANASGTGEFLFGLPVDRVLYIGPEDGVWTDYQLDPQAWLPQVGVLPLDAGQMWSSLIGQMAAPGDTGYAAFPIHLPSGAIIRQVDSLIYQMGPSLVSTELLETNHDWVTPFPAARVSRGGPWTNILPGAGFRLITSGGINAILTEGRGYSVVLKGLDSAGQVFLGMKVTYRYTYLRPNQ